MTGTHKYRLLVAVCLTVLVIDHASKFLAVEELTWAMTGLEDDSLGARVARFYTTPHPSVRRRVAVVPSFFHLRYVENPGAAFGLFAGMPASQRIPFFVAVSIGATSFILWFYRRVPDGHAALRWGLALVLGGALGNFIDRMARNYVIDFIDWHWFNQPGMHWPTFNLADTAISCGVMLLVYEMFRSRDREAVPHPLSPAPPDAPHPLSPAPPDAPHPLSPSPLDAERGDDPCHPRESGDPVPVSPSPRHVERGEGGGA